MSYEVNLDTMWEAWINDLAKHDEDPSASFKVEFHVSEWDEEGHPYRVIIDSCKDLEGRRIYEHRHLLLPLYEEIYNREEYQERNRD